ncbi:sensor histidine kinase [Paenibacillus allorhizosphaerae]|uniref:HAMP domain-containing protein n=1 Tax=Paenibacillus allorhizosphaerae TaxID=2849866 RepID=A0ABN7TU28_9BACL|nr:sensor histidine kinase [Paenibacillus allorhizosphaerae]CAG7655896.1 hypothetical protein PAECIP111802_06242 [Paenibacillus allorhizosphaerae]
MQTRWIRLSEWIQTFFLMRHLPLTVKLFLFSAFIVAVPLGLVGLISYERSADVLQSEANESSLQILEQVKSHVEYYVTDFEISTLRLLNHPDVVRLLKMRTLEEVQQSGIRKQVEQVLKNTTYSRSDISNITLMLDHLQTIDTAGFLSTVPAEELKKEYWYPGIPESGAPKLISRVIRYQDGRQEQVISIVRRVMSPYTLQPTGVMIVDINFKRIQEISEKVSIGRTGFMFILDSQNHYVYHPDLQLVGTPGPENEFPEMIKNDHGSFISADSPRSFLTYSRSPYLGWWLVTAIPYRELTDGITYIGHTIVWTIVITLAAAYLLGIGFAASLVRPIKRLRKYMRKVEVGDFSAGKLKVTSRDEIGQLTHGFNEMVKRLESLLEEIYFTRLRETEASLRQKETELKALQSQINPHFIYNSLETIRGMAFEHGMDDIAGMSASLAKLLRYNLKNDKPTVRLREELSFCEMYLRIQRYRFEERMTYELDVAEWAMEQPIVKFALQPIVENSMNHGIEPGIGRMQVQIGAYRDGNAYVVSVKDTGVGMKPEVLERIREDLECRDVLAGGEHIGISNVHRRIVYLYGPLYGVSVQSAEGTGTVVCIRLPFEQ